MSSPSRNFGQWKVLAISPDQGIAAELSTHLAEVLPFSPVHHLPEYPTRAVLSDALQEYGCNLCFVDAESSRDWALALISDLSMLDAKLPVVAIHAGNDSDYILRTLRQGAAEFLFRPLTVEQLLPVMERIVAQHRGKQANSAKVYAVMPAKGACGASTIACNMAQHSKRLGAKGVLLSDMDPIAGTVSFQLKLKQTYSFMDALTRGSQLDEDIWRGLVHTSGGVEVLLSPDQPVHGIDEAHNPAGIIDFTRSLYEVVVLDCSGPYGAWNQTIARVCDELLLVTTNELPALQAAQRSLAYFDRNRIDRSKVRVVVNRYNKDMGLSRDMIESALHCDVYQLVASDYEEIQRSLVEGKPVSAGTPVGRGVVELSEKLSGRKAAVPAPKTSSLSSLFSFMRR
jgi:pilus assembly protein CpaE